MSEETVLLAYRRTDGELSTGSFSLSVGDEQPTLLSSFEKLEFRKMLREFAVYLLQYPTAHGAIQRTDRPGLVRIQLAPDEIARFRRDPAEAIRQRIIPPQRVVIGVDKSTPRDKPAPSSVREPLKAGYATLVECFGDFVYARARFETHRASIECFCCGMWTPVEYNMSRPGYHCKKCVQDFPIEDIAREAGFLGIRVSTLLALPTMMKERFFLPRAWNDHKNWISRSDLERRYNEYIKEKES